MRSGVRCRIDQERAATGLLEPPRGGSGRPAQVTATKKNGRLELQGRGSASSEDMSLHDILKEPDLTQGAIVLHSGDKKVLVQIVGSTGPSVLR
jgi:hypothetical protein